ncbi:MAG: hypothetical protein CFE24_06815 [Flavobacterium sp. BFFFF2]|nr:MAG: hypothetical protein CFE24_06815 [Flavobacterium sp. BFFFF2]
MKTFFRLLAITLVIAGCTGPQGPQGFNGVNGADGLIATVYDLNNVNFSYTQSNGFFIGQSFNTPIYTSDNVIMYRKTGTVNNAPIWQQIPRTLYLGNGQELDYDFDFTKFDFTIYAGGNYDITTTSGYLNNQTFRVVVIPGGFGKRVVDYSDCNAVMQAYGLTESQVKTLTPKSH